MQVKDQIGENVAVQGRPVRIVSLVPSITELLWHLGLEDEVVGITKFCVRPDAWFRKKARVGGTKTVHLDRLLDLKPDLVIANKEENDEAQVRSISENVPTWVSDVRTLEDAFEMITSLGALVGKAAQALELTGRIRSTFASLPGGKKRAAYLVWNEPVMLAGADTFIHHMMEAMGFENVVPDSRYPQWSDERILAAQPEILLLPSEPFPFGEKHLASFAERFPSIPAALVDGEIFSWYGSRMLGAAAYARELQQGL